MYLLQITGREIPEVIESCIRFIKKFGRYTIFLLPFLSKCVKEILASQAIHEPKQFYSNVYFNYLQVWTIKEYFDYQDLRQRLMT